MVTELISQTKSEAISFEDLSVDNGGHYWYARDLMFF